MEKGERQRTKDVYVEQDIDFSGLLLSPPILQGLKEAGYLKPSPIQLKAIPLGRFGVDLIAQAKSGTGKTCVFSVIALEAIDVSSQSVQAIIVAPTREIAIQIKEVVLTIGKELIGMKCHAFVGGLPMATDLQNARNCHIAVGTPGRLGALLECGGIRSDSVKMIILDEADKLFDENLQDQTNFIFKCLSKRKQVLAFSATFPESLLKVLATYMSHPQHITMITDTVSLEGVKQYYSIIPQEGPAYRFFSAKVKLLLDILSKVAFHQCLVFSNDRRRAQQLALLLTSHGWPAAFIAGGQPQEQRMEAMTALRNFRLRVLVSTDLTSRGIDIERINLVINMDLPRDTETYLHRIGRTGRFGTYGVAVTFVSEKEYQLLKRICDSADTTIEELPDIIPAEYYAYELSDEKEKQILKKLTERREKVRSALPEGAESPEEYFKKKEQAEEKTKTKKKKTQPEKTDKARKRRTTKEEEKEKDVNQGGGEEKVKRRTKKTGGVEDSDRGFINTGDEVQPPLEGYWDHAYQAGGFPSSSYYGNDYYSPYNGYNYYSYGGYPDGTGWYPSYPTPATKQDPQDVLASSSSEESDSPSCSCSESESPDDEAEPTPFYTYSPYMYHPYYPPVSYSAYSSTPHCPSCSCFQR